MSRHNTTCRGPLPAPRVFADDSNLTRFSGTIPLIRYLSDSLDIVPRLRAVVGYDAKDRVYPLHIVLFVFLVGALAGVHRLAHIEWLRGDAVLLKFLRLPRWPVRKVFSNALVGLSDHGVQRLVSLIAAVGLEPLRGHERAVIDIDSSAIVTFGHQEGAKFGYSGKGRNRRRHHPLVASVAETRTVVHAAYRDGSAIDTAESISFTQHAVNVVRSFLAPGAEVTLRADSGFWSRAFGEWLLKENIPFVFSMGLHAGVKLLLLNTRWRGLDGDLDIQVAEIRGERLNLDARLRLIGIRRRVLDPKAPPQGKPIDGCMEWRYQALVTCLDGTPEAVWRFYNYRADCEQVFKVARGALGMGCLVSHDLRANETAFLLRLLAFNADRRFQMNAERHAKDAGRPSIAIGLLARQRRFYQAIGRLLKPSGQWILRVRDNRQTEQLWEFYAPELAASG